MIETMDISRSVWFSRNSAAVELPRKNQINTSVSKITEAVLPQLHDICRHIAHVFSILPKPESFTSLQSSRLRRRQGHNLGLGLAPIKHGDRFPALHGFQDIFGTV